MIHSVYSQVAPERTLKIVLLLPRVEVDLQRREAAQALVELQGVHRVPPLRQMEEQMPAMLLGIMRVQMQGTMEEL